MKKELRDAWVKALRSGEYKQGTRRMLNDDGSLCCLAVLCEVSGVGYPIAAYDLSSTKDLKEFRDDCGLDQCGIDSNEMLMEKLVYLNDVMGLNFTLIADWIEANIPVT